MFRHLNHRKGAFSLSRASALTILTVGLGVLMFSCSHLNNARVEDRPRIRVHTDVVRLTTITDEFEAPGTIRAKTQTVLSSKIVGQIATMRVREGDRVRRGDLLVEIEGRDAAAQLKRAQAAENEARKALDEVDGATRAEEASLRAAEADRDLAAATRKRYDLLRERGSVSPHEFEEVDTRSKAAASGAERAQESLAATKARRSQVLARIDQAEAEVEASRVVTDYLKITSPINGVVTARKAEPGMLATPGMPLLAVDDDTTYQLECVLEDSRLGIVAVGDSARVKLDALAPVLHAKVREIAPASDPATRTYTVKLDLVLSPLHRSKVYSGFFGRAFFRAGERQALIVPEHAVVERGQLTGVYVVKNNIVSFRLVKTGKLYDKGIEILSGLNPNTRIVTAPPPDIADGLQIVEENSEGTAP